MRRNTKQSLVGLNLALALIATKVEVKSDMQLVVGQIQREYEARNESMARYLILVDSLMNKLERWSIRCVPREKNGQANALTGREDALARVATTLLIQETTMLPIYLQATSFIFHEQVNDIVQTDLE